MQTDLQMVHRCAQALELDARLVSNQMWIRSYKTGNWDDPYDPLHDDAQCLALERHLLRHGVIRMTGSVFEFYPVKQTKRFQFVGNMSNPDDNRRARVECVARSL